MRYKGQNKSNLFGASISFLLGISALTIVWIVAGRYYFYWSEQQKAMAALKSSREALQVKVDQLAFQQNRLQKQVNASPEEKDRFVLKDRLSLSKDLMALEKDRFALTKDLLALEKDRITLESSITNGLAQATGGLVLFVTAYVAWENLKATRKNVEVAQEKQVTERFTQAINQLGSESKESEADKIAIRLGGIYALERIARDSEKDHWTIIEVLTSFIKHKSPATEDSEQSYPGIKQDVQAALTVVARRKSREKQEEVIDISKTNLREAQLSDAKFQGVNLASSKLSRADLRGADLRRANLQNAALNLADLSGADLTDAKLEGANLRGAIWRASQLCDE